MTDNRPYSVAHLRRLWMDPALTVADIAAELGVSIKTMQARRLRHGLPPRKGSQKPSLPRDELARMLDLGMSYGAIAEVFGCHVQTVNNNVRSHGLPLRGTGRRSRITAQEYREMVAAEARGAKVISPADQRDLMIIEMRLAGVGNGCIARAINASISRDDQTETERSVKERARILGLPRRKTGIKPVSLEQFREIKLAQRLRQSAPARRAPTYRAAPAPARTAVEQRNHAHAAD